MPAGSARLSAVPRSGRGHEDTPKSSVTPLSSSSSPTPAPAHLVCPCLIPEQAGGGGAGKSPRDIWERRSRQHARPAHSAVCWLEAGDHSGAPHPYDVNATGRRKQEGLSFHVLASPESLVLLGVWLHSTPRSSEPKPRLWKLPELALHSFDPRPPNTVIIHIKSRAPTPPGRAQWPITPCHCFIRTRTFLLGYGLPGPHHHFYVYTT